MPNHNGPDGIEHATPVPYGHARIALRFRSGDLPERVQANKDWTVYSMKYSVMCDLPLGVDGSLLTRKPFHIDDINFEATNPTFGDLIRIQLLQPGRYNLFKPAAEVELSNAPLYIIRHIAPMLSCLLDCASCPPFSCCQEEMRMHIAS